MKREVLPEGYRRCTTCKKLLPETEEYFLKFWDKRDNVYRFKRHCLECGKNKCKQWRQDNHKRYIEYSREYRKTEQCKESKRKYNETHKELVRERKRRYREKNINKIREYDHNRRYNEETREKVLNWSRQWRANNKDHIKDYNSQYVKSHMEYFRRATHIRNARVSKLEYNLTGNDWENIKKYFDNSCAYCGSKKILTQDHVVPVTKGGGYTKSNIIPACKFCNCSKHNLDMEEWYRRQPFYSKEREKRIKKHIENNL